MGHTFGTHAGTHDGTLLVTYCASFERAVCVRVCAILQQRQPELSDLWKSSHVAVIGDERRRRTGCAEGGAGTWSDAEPRRRPTTVPLQQVRRRYWKRRGRSAGS